MQLSESHYDDARAANIQRGIPNARLNYAIGDAWMQIEMLGVPPARALAGVDAELARQPLDELEPAERPYIVLATLYAETGRVDAARAMLARRETELPENMRGSGAGLHDALAAIALAERRYDDAIRETHARRRRIGGSNAISRLVPR